MAGVDATGGLNLLTIGRRGIVYGMGLLCMAFGVAFSVHSGLGVSPINSLPYVISLILKVDMGSCVIAVFSVYVLVQILIYRREFKWINLTQILFSILFGYFVDFAKVLVGDFAVSNYVQQLALLAVSMVLVALGVCLYMDAGLVNMPMEGMTRAIGERVVKRWPFHDVKVAVDCLAVAAALFMSLVFLHDIQGIREGTVLCAVWIGRMMKPMQKVLKPQVDRFCAGGCGREPEIRLEGESTGE